MKITLEVEFKNHNKVVLTNENGDTYTSENEGFIDFLHQKEKVPVLEKYKQYKKDYPHRTDVEYIEELSWEISDKIDTLNRTRDIIDKQNLTIVNLERDLKASQSIGKQLSEHINILTPKIDCKIY